MSAFTTNVAHRIFPLSVEQSHLLTAILEWDYTGRHLDAEFDAPETVDCQFCGYESIRHQFEIKNKHTAHQLWVGSKCIVRFTIGGLEGVERVVADLGKLQAEISRRKRRATWLTRRWLVSRKGNEYLKRDVGIFTVFSVRNKWNYSYKDPDDGSGFFGSADFASSDEAKLAVFDVLNTSPAVAAKIAADIENAKKGIHPDGHPF